MKNLLASLIVIAWASASPAAGPTTLLQVSPQRGSPVDLYRVPVGTTRELAFELPVKAERIVAAHLAMMVDDIDARNEASIRLNGGSALHIPDAAVAEAQFHPAFMEVPVEQLRDGSNVFVFSFDSNLGGSTLGYVIDEAYLMLAVPASDAGRLGGLPGVRGRAHADLAGLMADRAASDSIFEFTGASELPGGFEIPPPFPTASIVSGMDGQIRMFYGNEVSRSADGGRTWSPREKIDIGVNGVVRLNSGLLGARQDMTFHVSPDDGRTWEKRGNIAAGAKLRWEGRGVGHFDVLIQTKSGRILLPVRGSAAANSWLAQRSAARALFQGEVTLIEGHAHRPEADFTIVYYSDDEGRTWQKADGTIMIWKDDGLGGMWPADEPNIVALSNGDVMCYFRTTLGRIYTARSSAVTYTIAGGRRKGEVVKGEPGTFFDYPQATDLAAPYTPCRVRRIPGTGDLLLVWNHVTADEMRGGHSRGRLASAISRDDGRTWEHFRTIDRTVLAPAGRVEPDPEPGMARALKFIGELTPGYGHVDYPNVGFHEDKVLVTWLRGITYTRPGEFTGARLRVVPVSWFYEDQPPYREPEPTPGLIVAGRSVAGLFIDGGFLVNSRDVAAALGMEVEANMLAPLHQVLTHLRLEPVYDRTRMADAEEPALHVSIGGR